MVTLDELDKGLKAICKNLKIYQDLLAEIIESSVRIIIVGYIQQLEDHERQTMNERTELEFDSCVRAGPWC